MCRLVALFMVLQMLHFDVTVTALFDVTVTALFDVTVTALLWYEKCEKAARRLLSFYGV